MSTSLPTHVSAGLETVETMSAHSTTFFGTVSVILLDSSSSSMYFLLTLPLFQSSDQRRLGPNGRRDRQDLRDSLFLTFHHLPSADL